MTVLLQKHSMGYTYLSSMDKSDIITLPHKALHKVSRRVVVFNDDTSKIIENMKSATLNWETSRDHEVGVALAAVQINELHRIVIIREDSNDKNNKNFNVYINPEIVKYEGEIEEDFEGCLSIKDVYGKVPRYTKVRVKALNEHGQKIRLKAEGFLARVFQHEIDHTKGKVFVDHIEDKPEAFYKLSKAGNIEEMNDAEKKQIFSILW